MPKWETIDIIDKFKSGGITPKRMKLAVKKNPSSYRIKREFDGGIIKLQFRKR